jgi:hypothetical protein
VQVADVPVRWLTGRINVLTCWSAGSLMRWCALVLMCWSADNCWRWKLCMRRANMLICAVCWGVDRHGSVD